MTLVKGPEDAGPPPKALMEAIAKLGEDAAKAGVMVENGGLQPSERVWPYIFSAPPMDAETIRPLCARTGNSPGDPGDAGCRVAAAVS